MASLGVGAAISQWGQINFEYTDIFQNISLRWTEIFRDIYFDLILYRLKVTFPNYAAKADVLQLDRTKFSSLEIFVSRKVGNQKN